MTNKVLARHNPAPAATYAPAVTSIDPAELWEALRPLLAAVGTSLDTVIAGTLKVEHDRITFLSIEPMLGVDPIAYTPNRPPSEGFDGWAAIWAWPVTVKVLSPDAVVDDADLMCPNCITPWKCNGPHIEELHDLADVAAEFEVDLT